MATYTDVNSTVDAFTKLPADEQLALLWFVYEKMGDSVTPAATAAAAPEIAGGLLEQVKQKSHQEQLQIMRALVTKTSSEITRQYGSLSDNTKLAFWYFLAQGMDEETIIPMPDDYRLTTQGEALLNSISLLEFQQQITVLRDIVSNMGSEPASGAKI